jgi:hypothetical protein
LERGSNASSAAQGPIEMENSDTPQAMAVEALIGFAVISLV